MAIGTLFIFATPGYAPNLMSFLFGDILTVSRLSLGAMAVVALVLVVVMLLWRRAVIYASFDREYARSQGVKADAVLAFMTVMTAVTIVLSIRVVGIVLLISLLTVPPTIVGMFTKSYSKIVLWSSVLAAVGNVVGIWVAYKMDFPVGATTIILLTLTLFIVKLLTLPSLRAKLRPTGKL